MQKVKNFKYTKKCTNGISTKYHANIVENSAGTLSTLKNSVLILYRYMPVYINPKKRK